MSDRVAEQGTDLGDPVHYAEELRQAAGLPPMRSAKKRGLGEGVRGFVPALRSLWQRLYAKPAGAATVDFFRSLRPVWWVLRGWFIFAAFMTVVSATPFPGMNPLTLIFFLAALVLSVQWGRGK